MNECCARLMNATAVFSQNVILCQNALRTLNRDEDCFDTGG